MTSLRLDSDVLVGSEDGRLWDLYGKPLERMIFNDAGTWRPVNISIPKIKFRYDLGGVILKGVLVVRFGADRHVGSQPRQRVLYWDDRDPAEEGSRHRHLSVFLPGGEGRSGVLRSEVTGAQARLQKDYRSISARVYSISLLILGLVLYSYYSAAIMNGLLSPAPGSVRNVKDVIRSPMKASLARVPYMIPKVKAYVTPGLLAKTKKQEKSEQMLDVFVGVDRIRHERLTLVADDMSLYAVINEKYTDAEKCNLMEIEDLTPSGERNSEARNAKMVPPEASMLGLDDLHTRHVGSCRPRLHSVSVRSCLDSPLLSTMAALDHGYTALNGLRREPKAILTEGSLAESKKCVNFNLKNS
ncbi:unnamed protein product [Nezara viridula]|nr:unnamed protein product [Nezara viridula]